MNHDRNAVYSQFMRPDEFNTLLRNEIESVTDIVRMEMTTGLQQFKEGKSVYFQQILFIHSLFFSNAYVRITDFKLLTIFA